MCGCVCTVYVCAFHLLNHLLNHSLTHIHNHTTHTKQARMHGQTDERRHTNLFLLFGFFFPVRDESIQGERENIRMRPQQITTLQDIHTPSWISSWMTYLTYLDLKMDSHCTCVCVCMW